MACRAAAIVTGVGFLWFFVSEGFISALKEEQSRILEGVAGTSGSADGASIDARPPDPPSVHSIRSSAPITDSRGAGWTASKTQYQHHRCGGSKSRNDSNRSRSG